MRSGRTVTWATAATLGFGLVACGGSTSGGGGTTGGGGETPGASPSATAKAAAQEKTAVNSAGKLTPPGKRLKLGQAATLGWIPLDEATGSGAKKGLKVKVVVQSIEKGKIADFSNVKLNASQKKTTPYYVRVKITALAKTKPKGTDDPHIALRAIDDRDQAQGRIIVFGTFPKCDSTAAPKPFVSGKSYETCLAYLMAGGGSIKSVEWNDGPAKADKLSPYFDKPVVWAGR